MQVVALSLAGVLDELEALLPEHLDVLRGLGTRQFARRAVPLAVGEDLEGRRAFGALVGGVPVGRGVLVDALAELGAFVRRPVGLEDAVVDELREQGVDVATVFAPNLRRAPRAVRERRQHRRPAVVRPDRQDQLRSRLVHPRHTSDWPPSDKAVWDS